MPPTTDTSGPDLGIRLENNPAHYCPGDTVLGHVYRTSPAKFSEATIDVSLHGLSISRIYGGEYVKEINDWDCHLVYGDATKQQLFNGEISISNEQEAIQKWPFSITIPKNVDPRLGAHWNAPDDGEFLPMNAEAVQNVGLPPSFEMGHWRRCDEGIIDYFVQTELSFPGQDSLCSVKATFPLKIVCFNPGPPIADNKLQQRDKSLAIQSYSLAGLQKANLSRTQKLKKMFKSSSIPKFAFDLQTWIPTVLQIDNPGYVPLLLGVIPRLDETSESIRQMSHQLKLTRLEIGIDTVLQLKGLGTDDSVLTDKKNID